jgi:hypothetical protein
MTTISDLPEFLSREANFALYAPRTEVSLEAAVEMICEVIDYCRTYEIGGLLVDARELYGFSQPSVVDRYWFLQRWATGAGGQLVMSMIQRPEMIDPEGIGITIAANAGLQLNVFDNEPAARAWLLDALSK